MGTSAADEKRQEERRVKELREFQRSTPANRHCFDCNEMMPQYVCLDFNTFVCTACSGIHREFAHRVKSLSMSKFTETEVKNMTKFGGNDAAQKYWRAKHDPSFRPGGGTDGERTRNFIRLTYIDRKWVYESPRHSIADQPQASSSKPKSTAKTVSKTSSRDDDFFSSGGGGGFDAFGSSNAGAATGDGGFASFGDFSAFESATTSTSKPAQGFADFGAFDSPSTVEAEPVAVASSPEFAAFGDLDSAPSASVQPSASVKHEFASFKLAPPPGAQFASSTASTASSTPGAAATSSKPANDFMAFSPEHKKSGDPFGFDDAAPPASTASSPSSPFDAFGESTNAPAPTSAPAAAPFDAFGASSNSSAFDAFGASSSTALDPFGAKPKTNSSSSGLDIFGAANASAPAVLASATADPFDAFNPRTSSGAPSHETANPVPSASDPFSAFDTLESIGSAPAAPATSSVSSSRGESESIQSAGGFSGQSAPQASSSNDPFAFANSVALGSESKSDSFSAMGGSLPSANTHNAFGQGFAPMQQGHHHPAGAGGYAPPGYNAMYMQQPQVPMHLHHHQQQQQQLQQQWYGQNPAFPGHKQQNIAFQGHSQQPQQMYPAHPSTTTPQPAPSREGSSSQLKAAAPSAASINDPFASLSITNTMGSAGSSVSRGNSFSHPTPASSSSSFSHANPSANPMMTGATGSFGNPVAASAPGSRGQSFQSSAIPAAGMGAPSPAAAFSYPQQPALAQAPSPSQSPMGSFSFPAVPAAPGFAAFPSSANASRPNSFTQPPSQPPASSANPFDMF